MLRRTLLGGLLGAMSACLPLAKKSALSPPPPPNILLITVDDMGFDSLGANGCPIPGITPYMDRLAAQGLRFENAHVTISLCQPSRSVMMTGRYPHRSGALGFEPINQGIPTLPGALAEAGWLTGIHGKVNHIKPYKMLRWGERIGGQALGEGRDPAAYGEAALAFFRKAKAEGRPFFLMSNPHDPHRPFPGSADEARWPRGRNYPAPSRIFKPEDVPLPPSLPDLPDIRQEFAQYYAAVHRGDASVGAVLQALEIAGLASSTLVICLSDNGFAFPFAKATCYLAGTRTPWLMRWPGVIPPGLVDGAHMVSALDLAPTILDSVALPTLEGVDGRSFLPLLLRGQMEGFTSVNTVFHRTFDKDNYPTRCHQTRELGYLYNPWSRPGATFDVEAERGLTREAMGRLAKSSPEFAARLRVWEERSVEELYDLKADPGCLNNLVGDGAFAQALGEERAGLLRWMERTGDPLEASFRAYLEGMA